MTETSAAGALRGTTADPRRWKALALLGIVQFMLTLDMTVVNVALPAIQQDLGMSGAGLAWVVDAYILMAGGLLLFGGRLSDLYGRRRMFVIGVSVFTVASALCGMALSPEMLIGGRLLQGVGEAFAVPAALGLIVVMFTDPAERAKALGIWGGLTGLGGMVGSVVSGVLTDLASWRWIFLINIPVAVVALAFAASLVPIGASVMRERRIDVAGALTATGGLLAVVYGLLGAAQNPWTSVEVALPIIGGVLLLGAMLVIESRSSAPLIPLSFFRHRTRAAGYTIVVLHTAGFFSMVFLMTQYMQNVLGYSPLQAGLAFLPFAVAMGLGIGFSGPVLARLGLRPTLVVGFLVAAAGMLVLSTISTSSTYLLGVMPGLVIFSFATGIMMPATMTATLNDVSEENSGLGSSLQGVVQQLGGALGLAVIAVIALRAAGDASAAGIDPGAAATSGYAVAYRLAAVLLVVASVVSAVVIRPGIPVGDGHGPDGPQGKDPADAAPASATSAP